MNGLFIILGVLCLGLSIYLILYAIMGSLEVKLYEDIGGLIDDWVEIQSDVNVTISDLDEIRELVKNDDKLLKKLDDIENNINLKTQIIEDSKNNGKNDFPTDQYAIVSGYYTICNNHLYYYLEGEC